MSLTQALKNKIKGKFNNTVSYTAPKPAKPVLVEIKPSPKKKTPPQYGDKGYVPSSGTGVGY